jgi:hypothetical protein
MTMNTASPTTSNQEHQGPVFNSSSTYSPSAMERPDHSKPQIGELILLFSLVRDLMNHHIFNTTAKSRYDEYQQLLDVTTAAHAIERRKLRSTHGTAAYKIIAEANRNTKHLRRLLRELAARHKAIIVDKVITPQIEDEITVEPLPPRVSHILPRAAVANRELWDRKPHRVDTASTLDTDHVKQSSSDPRDWSPLSEGDESLYDDKYDRTYVVPERVITLPKSQRHITLHSDSNLREATGAVLDRKIDLDTPDELVANSEARSLTTPDEIGDAGNKRRVAQKLTTIGNYLDSPSRNSFDDTEFKHGKALDFPEIPGSEYRNLKLRQIRQQYHQHQGDDTNEDGKSQHSDEVRHSEAQEPEVSFHDPVIIPETSRRSTGVMSNSSSEHDWSRTRSRSHRAEEMEERSRAGLERDRTETPSPTWETWRRSSTSPHHWFSGKLSRSFGQQLETRGLDEDDGFNEDDEEAFAGYRSDSIVTYEGSDLSPVVDQDREPKTMVSDQDDNPRSTLNQTEPPLDQATNDEQGEDIVKTLLSQWMTLAPEVVDSIAVGTAEAQIVKETPNALPRQYFVDAQDPMDEMARLPLDEDHGLHKAFTF